MAKYLVTAEPGAVVPGLGFLQPGTIFTAPEEPELKAKFVPSKSFVPVDKEAHAELVRIHGEKAVKPIYSPPTVERKVEPDAVPLSKLGHVGGPAAVPAAPTKDRKL